VSDCFVVGDTGLAPTPPDDCPEYMADLMKRCFTFDPEERITFGEAVSFLYKFSPKPTPSAFAPTATNNNAPKATKPTKKGKKGKDKDDDVHEIISVAKKVDDSDLLEKGATKLQAGYTTMGSNEVEMAEKAKEKKGKSKPAKSDSSEEEGEEEKPKQELNYAIAPVHGGQS